MREWSPEWALAHGEHDRKRGKLLADSPFKAGNELHKAWKEGWSRQDDKEKHFPPCKSGQFELKLS